MNSYANDLIHPIVSHENNSQCFDCTSPHPTWASSNNSVFLCAKCALMHKSLGEDISIVKSLEVSPWSDKEITVLKIGGNKRLSSLFDEYKVQNRIAKYNTRIAHFYRKFIAMEASLIDEKDLDEQYKQLLTMKPSIETGGELIDKSGEEAANECEPPAQTVHEGVKEDFDKMTKTVFGWIGGAFQTTTRVIGIDKKLAETKEEINLKLSKIEVNPTVKEAGSKVYEALKYSTALVSSKVKETEAYKTMTHGVDQGYITLKQTLQDIVKPFKYNDDNEANLANDSSSGCDNNCNAPPQKGENDTPASFIDINRADYP